MFFWNKALLFFTLVKLSEEAFCDIILQEKEYLKGTKIKSSY